MSPFTATVDTGSGQSHMPNNSLKGYYEGVPGSIWDVNGHCFDYVCTLNESLPNLVLFLDNDQKVVVERHPYAYWSTMHPRESNPPPEAGTRYCTNHIRGNWFSSYENWIGSDIIKGLVLVMDYGNNRIGMANSSVMTTIDPSFRVPKDSWDPPPPPPPMQPDCNYTLSNPTIKPTIKGCTAADFGGSCSEIQVTYPGCTDLTSNGIELASVQPLEDSNMRCSLYADTECEDTIPDANGMTYPGAKTLSRTPQSIACVSTGIKPAAEAGANWSSAGERLDGKPTYSFINGVRERYGCNVQFDPPEETKYILKGLTHQAGFPRAGSCIYFQDAHCRKLVSSPTGVDMCNSDNNNITVPVDFGSGQYIGSYMCV